MDIGRIKSGRPKPKFVVALEWLTLGTLGAAIALFLGRGLHEFAPVLFDIMSFLLLIEVGLLSILYGMEGIRYKMIWLTYPTPTGQRRAAFSSGAAILVGSVYLLMGLSFIVLALMFSYYRAA